MARAIEDVRARVHDPNFLDEVRRGRGLASDVEAQAFVLDNIPLLATALFGGFDRIVGATIAQREKIIRGMHLTQVTSPLSLATGLIHLATTI